MEDIKLLNADKSLTKDGLQVKEWLQAQCDYAESLPLTESVNHMNTVSGPIRQYYLNVYKLKSHTAEAWIQDFSQTWAADCWRIMKRTEEAAQQAQTVTETADKTAALEVELAALKTKLAGYDGLEAKVAALEAKKPAPAKKPVTSDDKADDEEADAESEV